MNPEQKQPSPDHLKAGKEAETAAIAYLSQRRYKILTSNYRTRRGEIDIVCRHRNYLVFVEVKSRAKEGQRFLGDRVDLRKQRRIIQAARDYLTCHEIPEGGIRFDVILMTATPGGEWKIEHIEDAFRLESEPDNTDE